MATNDKRRIDRCRDCFCLMEMPASKWFCDQYQDQCVNIIECGEWEFDPSIYSEEEIRLEQIRKEILNESISYGEIIELKSLAKYIKQGDVLLLEWANVPE